MAADHLEFLKNKFISELEEAVGEFPLRLHFVEILEVLIQTRITSSTPIGLKDSLYDLKFALADCVMLAEKERNRSSSTTQRKKETSFFFGFHYMKKKWFLFQTKRKLLRIKNQWLLQHMSDCFANEWPSPSLVWVYEPANSPDFNLTIHGFNEHLQKMEALLLKDTPTATATTTTTTDDDGIRTIGIVGMGGSGKTTLAQMVFHSPRIQESFSPMLWVELPQYPHLRCIVLAILNCLASDFSCDILDDNLDDLLGNMHLHLLNKKYLIVLDNMWHASNDWYLDDFDFLSKLQMESKNYIHLWHGLTMGSEKISMFRMAGNNSNTNNYTHLWPGLPRGSGGAIIVTSRLKEVASEMVGELNLYQLEPILDEESCWSIILDSVGEEISDHPILLKMKDDMVERCGGLPLAAKTLARKISNEFFPDPSAIKMFRLIFNKPVAPTSQVLEELRAYPGVYYANIVSDHNNEVETGGSCDPQKVVEELMKFSHGQITLKIDIN